MDLEQRAISIVIFLLTLTAGGVFLCAIVLGAIYELLKSWKP
jgi:hypothetical protein